MINGITPSQAPQRNLISQFKEISSGKRSFATTSPAVLMIGQRMLDVAGSTRMANQNVEMAMSRSQTTDAYLQQSGDMVSRLKELTIRAGDGTLSDNDRDALQKEADQLVEQLNQNYQNASFNGQKLLQGGDHDVAITSDGDTTKVHNGDLNLGLSDLDITDTDNAIDALDAALESLSQQRVQQGVDQSSLQNRYEANLAVEANLREAAAKRLDTDMAEAMTELSSAQILNDIGNAVAAQGANISSEIAADLA